MMKRKLNLQTDKKKIRIVALDLLAQREHSRLELQNKLLQKDFAHDEVELLLNTLIAENLLSDERFCEAFIRNRIKKGQGGLRIKEELRQRGISNELISHYLNSQNDWQEKLAIVRRKKFGDAIPKDFKERAKQMRFLQYRGFSIEQINEAFREASSRFESRDP